MRRNYLVELVTTIYSKWGVPGVLALIVVLGALMVGLVMYANADMESRVDAATIDPDTEISEQQ